MPVSYLAVQILGRSLVDIYADLSDLHVYEEDVEKFGVGALGGKLLKPVWMKRED